MKTATRFGKVTVYVTEVSVLDSTPRVEVNWAAIGSVSVDTAKAFQRELFDALIFAESERKRLGA